jgi:hypothetical protein
MHDEVTDLWSAPIDATRVDDLPLGEDDLPLGEDVALSRLASLLLEPGEQAQPTGLGVAPPTLRGASAAAEGAPPAVALSRRRQRQEEAEARGRMLVVLEGFAASRFAMVSLLLVAVYLVSAVSTVFLTGGTPKAEVPSPPTPSLEGNHVFVNGPATCPMYEEPFSVEKAAQSRVCFLVN